MERLKSLSKGAPWLARAASTCRETAMRAHTSAARSHTPPRRDTVLDAHAQKLFEREKMREKMNIYIYTIKMQNKNCKNRGNDLESGLLPVEILGAHPDGPGRRLFLPWRRTPPRAN
eukprot:3523655-Rhodomonas_salina.2